MKFVDDTLYVKLVFFGAAMVGKTEVIKCLHGHVFSEDERTGASLKQLNTTSGRTLLFDFTTVKLEPSVVARLFSVSGQNYYRSTRLHSMQETDAVFLILDAQEEAMERNAAACDELRQYKSSIDTMRDAPVIALINKWEMRTALPMFSVVRNLRLQDENWPYLVVNPLTGQNIARSFEMMKRLISSRIADCRWQRRLDGRNAACCPASSGTARRTDDTDSKVQAWQLD